MDSAQSATHQTIFASARISKMSYEILPEFNNGLDGTNTNPIFRGYKIKTWGLKDWCKSLNKKFPNSHFAPTKGLDGLWHVGKLIEKKEV